jgi:serine/threonine protein kinase
MEAVHYKVGEYQYRTDRPDDILGKGSFGNVYKGKDKNGNFVDIKIISNSRLVDPKTAVIMVNEINILKKINHPNVLTFITEIRDKENLYLITECCNYDLKKFIDEKAPDEETCVKILKDIVKGYDYIHKAAKIAHRDIKLENILIKMVDGKYIAKIADYGFARFIETATTLTDVLMGSYLGSHMYMAPEIETGEYNYTVDIYALGIVYYFMLFHDFPNIIDSSQYTIDLENILITKSSYSFITQCIKGYAQRLHLDKVLSHPLINCPFDEYDYHEKGKFVLTLN